MTLVVFAAELVGLAVSVEHALHAFVVRPAEGFTRLAGVVAVETIVVVVAASGGGPEQEQSGCQYPVREI